MIVGCYSLHLYCSQRKKDYSKDLKFGHKHCEFPHEYTGYTRGSCCRQARDDGWLISKKRQLCPTCRKKEKLGQIKFPNIKKSIL